MSDPIPSYYRIGEGDVFSFLRELPLPSQVHEVNQFAVCSIFATAFRYARRCLWKGPSQKEMAEDARKAAECFRRLAEILNPSQTQEAPEVPSTPLCNPIDWNRIRIRASDIRYFTLREKLETVIVQHTGCRKSDARLALEPYILPIWKRATDATLESNLP